MTAIPGWRVVVASARRLAADLPSGLPRRPTGSLVAPHIDRPGYDLAVLLVLSHVLRANNPGVHRAFRLQAERLFVVAGKHRSSAGFAPA